MRSRIIAVAVAISTWVVPHIVAADDDRGWVVLTIGHIQVEPTDADGNSWDKVPPHQYGVYCDVDCDLVGRIGGAAGPLAGHAMKGACQLANDPDACKHQEAPDLVVLLFAGNTVLSTPIKPNSLTATFNTPMVVPLDGVPEDGLLISVEDYDGPGKDLQDIGAVRVTRKQLEGALMAGTAIWARHAGKIVEITMGVSQYVSPATSKALTFDVASAPVAIGATARAGELVLVQARGQYSAKMSGELIDERGYASSERTHHYNLPDFPDSNQGGAIARIGTVTSLFVGSCAGVVPAMAGGITVGINDDAPKHNKGVVEFRTWVKRPTLEQWQKAGTEFACTPRW
jgi:hypothetical protein